MSRRLTTKSARPPRMVPSEPLDASRIKLRSQVMIEIGEALDTHEGCLRMMGLLIAESALPTSPGDEKHNLAIRSIHEAAPKFGGRMTGKQFDYMTSILGKAPYLEKLVAIKVRLAAAKPGGMTPDEIAKQEELVSEMYDIEEAIEEAERGGAPGEPTATDRNPNFGMF